MRVTKQSNILLNEDFDLVRSAKWTNKQNKNFVETTVFTGKYSGKFD